MPDENRTQLKVWLQNVAFILILALLISFRLMEISILPFSDENYHFSDALVNSSYWDFNMFKKNSYRFFGHPLGYPLSLKIMIDLLGPTLQVARLHALFFSMGTLFVFFLLLRKFISFFAAVLITLAFYYSTIFYTLTFSITGDMSALFLSLVTIYFLFKEHYTKASVALLAAMFFRESTLALSTGILCAYGVSILISNSRPTLKKVLWVTLPSLAFLGVFFLKNIFFYQTFSRHPYALKKLTHTQVSFFEWSDEKWHGLNILKRIYLANFNNYFLVAIVLCLCYIFYKYKSRLSFPFLSYLFFALYVLIFFCAYGDPIDRDVLPTMSFLFFLVAFSLHIFPRIFQTLMAGLLIIYSVAHLRIPQYRYVTFYKDLAHYIETHYWEKNIYLEWPLSVLNNKVHGYFKEARRFKNSESTNVDVIIIDTKTSAMSRARALNKVHNEGFVLTKTISKYHYKAEIYEKPTQK